MDNKDKIDEMNLKIYNCIDELLYEGFNPATVSYFLTRKSAELSFFFCKDTRVIAVNLLDAIRDELDFQIQKSQKENKNINKDRNDIEFIEPITKTIQ